MAIRQLLLPLFNDPYYSYSTNLEGNTYILEFLFLERLKSWVLTLKDSEQNVLVRNQRLTQNTLLFKDYKLPNLNGGFYFTPSSEFNPDKAQENIENPRDFFRFYYIYDDGV